MNRTATISPCGLYRYDLTRTWDEARKPAAFIHAVMQCLGIGGRVTHG